jgi:hypothetical protein
VSRGSVGELAMQKDHRNHTKAVIECAVTIIEWARNGGCWGERKRSHDGSEDQLLLQVAAAVR